ncbi:hypothetical protein ROJ8625_02758 [Roseivivax jejudonensis]|uniref:Tat pathway signal sequence domain protein n=1 Tax=Roseivivax jejudonensis TaxID=1529041 RepID=A0A1X6ZLZ2_9RHOB|nr:hypothetical protein [Roseivivax jejudonensis]SLN55205.1 hypothetical protein ROJ8625_02758 [Roseivivax jejudonensis]
MTTVRPLAAAAALCGAAAMSPAAAQEDLGARLSIELNAAETDGESCKMSFVVLNGHDSDVAQAVFETVLFDADGQVDRLTLFDFGALPAGRPRVRQFVISGTPCDGLGRVLFNGADRCEAEALDPAACETDIRLESRTDIEVIG